MAAVTESSAAMGMERRDWLKVSLATISRNHEFQTGVTVRKRLRRTDGQTDGRTDGQTD